MSDDLNFNDDDLGLDDDFSGFDMDLDPLADPPPPKNKREAATRSLKDAAKGFAEEYTLDPIKVATDLSKSAIPRHLTKETELVTNVYDNVKEEFLKAGNEVKSTAKTTLQSIQKILPKDSTLNAMASMLIDKLTDYRPEYESEDDTERKNKEIQNLVDGIIGKKSEKEDYQKILDDQIEQNRFKSNIDLLSVIATSSQSSSDFNNFITTNYYRESLRLEYSQLFTMKEHLSLTRNGFDTFKNQLEHIVNNTALPDMIKMQKREMLMGAIRNRIFNNVGDKLFAKDSLADRIKTNIGKKISSVKDTALSALGTAGMMADQKAMVDDMPSIPGSNKSTMAGGMAAGKLNEFLGVKLRDIIENSKMLKNSIIGVKDFTTNPEEFFTEKMYEHSGSGYGDRIMRGVFGGLKSMTAYDRDYGDMIRMDKMNMDDVSTFNNKTQASITMVIPELLSKIYSEAKAIRTGTNKPEDYEMSYDYHKQAFITNEDIKNVLESRVKQDISKDTVYNIDRFLSKIAEYGPLEVTKETEPLLRKGLMSYFMDGGTLSLGKMLTNNFKDQFDMSLQEPLLASLSGALDAAKEDPYLYSNLLDYIKTARDSIPSMQQRVNEMRDIGKSQLIEDMGLAKYDEFRQEYIFDRGKYKEMLVKLAGESESSFGPEEKENTETENIPSENIEERTILTADNKQQEELDNTATKLQNLSDMSNTGNVTVSVDNRDLIISINNLSSTVKEQFNKLNLSNDLKNIAEKISEVRDGTNNGFSGLDKTIVEFNNMVKSCCDAMYKKPSASNTNTNTNTNISTNTNNNINTNTNNTNTNNTNTNNTNTNNSNVNNKTSNTTNSIKDKLSSAKEYINNKTEDIKNKMQRNPINEKETISKYSNTKDIFKYAKKQADDIVNLVSEKIDKEKISEVNDSAKNIIKERKEALDKRLKEVNKSEIKDVKNKAADIKNVATEKLSELFNKLSGGKVEKAGGILSSLPFGIGDKIKNGYGSLRDAFGTGKITGIKDLLSRTRNVDRMLAKGAWNKLTSLGGLLKRDRKTALFGNGIDAGLGFGKTISDRFKSNNRLEKTGDNIRDIGNNLLGKFTGKKDLVNSIGEAIAKAIPKKESKVSKESKPKVNVFDRDGSGRRDGDWRDRLNFFKKKDGSKKKSGLLGKITSKAAGSGSSTVVTLLTTMAGMFGKSTGVLFKILKSGLKLPKLLMGIGKGIFSIPKLLMNIGSGIFKLPQLLLSGMGGLFSKLTGSLGGIIGKLGGGLVGKIGGLFGKGVGGKVATSVGAKMATKIGTKVGLKAAGSLAGKFASRLVPGLGWGLAAWDAVNVGKKMLMDGKSFKSAMSEQFLGSDITDDAGKYDNKETSKDEPKEQVEQPVKEQETTKSVKPSEVITEEPRKENSIAPVRNMDDPNILELTSTTKAIRETLDQSANGLMNIAKINAESLKVEKAIYGILREIRDDFRNSNKTTVSDIKQENKVSNIKQMEESRSVMPEPAISLSRHDQ